MKPGIFLAAPAFALVMSCCGCRADAVIREPAHAGAFYPAPKDELSRQLDGFLTEAGRAGGATPRAVVVPHAGYVFSGAAAAFAYRMLEGKGSQVERVILLAPSHYAGFSGVVVNDRTYRTPLGAYRTDSEAIAKLKKSVFPASESDIASTREHADEVQVPFLQKVLPKAKLVPLVVGELDQAGIEEVARALATIVDDRTVIVVSSDFTHYGPNYGYEPHFKGGVRRGIAGLDQGAIELIAAGDAAGFAGYLEKTGDTICGRNPILVALKLFEVQGWKARGRLLRYATSGSLTGDWTNSVSYAAIALGSLGGEAALEGEKYLSREEEGKLLKLARHVLEKFVRDGVSSFPEGDLDGFGLTPTLRKDFGVFVTLNKSGNLRGCIGHITPEEALYQGVIENTMNAAARDPRFPPVTPEELKEITMEISVMSPLRKVGSLGEIKVGRDGLVLVCGSNSGVFLPQVPVEWNWDKTAYLENLGEKAGLDRGAYKRKDAVLFRFTAQVFGEESR